jgi:hypothetical protein
MPNGIRIEMRVTLEGASNFAHERLGFGYCLLERTAARVVPRTHPGIIDPG